MDICSFEFLLGCCLAPILFHLLPGRIARQLFLSLLNLAFLSTFIPNTQTLACFVTFVCGTYAIVWLIRRCPSGRIVFLAIVGILIAFLVIKRYTFVQWAVPEYLWNHPIAMIGISYMLFRFIHVLVDSWQGQLENCSLFSYTNYQLGFFTLVAGPIQRYNDFHRDWVSMDQGPGEKRQILLAWNRILTGFIKMGGLGAVAIYIHDFVGANWTQQSATRMLLRFMIFFYSYAIFLYLNFSGYTDIVIGCARLFGFKLPENFNQPYLSRNLIDFWNRWHITLSHWIRDYVFMTSYKLSAEKFPKSCKYIGYFLLFMSLFLAGVWHGSTPNFAIFGFIQGLGVLIARIYGDILLRALGRPGYQDYQKNRWFRWIAICVTIHYFCFSLLFFAMSSDAVFQILGSVWRSLV